MTERIVGDKGPRALPGSVSDRRPQAEFEEVPLQVGAGAADGRYYPSAGATAGMIWVGGVGGGWDSPASSLYPHLCAQLTSDGVASLRVRFRSPGDLENCTRDVLAGTTFLESKGVTKLGLVGWSFGGAVVMNAGARSPLVKTVATVATQSYGADAVSDLPMGCSTLVMHGTGDTVLPSWCSVQVHRMAHEPKELVLFEGANHGLEEAVEEVHEILGTWIREKLARTSLH